MNAGQLSEEIQAALGYDTRIRISDAEVLIQLKVTLTEEEKATLDTLLEKHVYTPTTVNPNQELIDWIEDSWNTGMPEKTEILKTAVLRILGVE